MERSKTEADEENQAFLAPSPASEDGLDTSRHRNGCQTRATWCLRLVLELVMAAVILVLLISRRYHDRDTLRRTPVPQFPRKMYTFRDNPRYLHGDMWFNKTETLYTLHNWIELSSDSRGFVVVKDAGLYDLPEPYTIATDRFNDGPGYMMTVFHQLHCLSYLAEHYQQGYGGVELTKEVAHHTAHCFNYLRQGIMCSADTTLEGKTDEGPGEGSEHECADYHALLKWANDNSAMKWRPFLPPEATL